MDDHGVFEGGVGEDVAGFYAAVFGHDEGAGGADGDVEPCGGSAGRECGVGDGEAEGFGYDLGCSGGAEELAATSGGGTGSATDVLGILEGDFALSESGADGLDHAGVFATIGCEGDAAGDDDDWFVAESGEGHHHCGETFVAGCYAHDAARSR